MHTGDSCQIPFKLKQASHQGKLIKNVVVWYYASGAKIALFHKFKIYVGTPNLTLNGVLEKNHAFLFKGEGFQECVRINPEQNPTECSVISNTETKNGFTVKGGKGISISFKTEDRGFSSSNCDCSQLFQPLEKRGDHYYLGMNLNTNLCPIFPEVCFVSLTGSHDGVSLAEEKYVFRFFSNKSGTEDVSLFDLVRF